MVACEDCQVDAYVYDELFGIMGLPMRWIMILLVVPILLGFSGCEAVEVIPEAVKEDSATDVMSEREALGYENTTHGYSFDPQGNPVWGLTDAQTAAPAQSDSQTVFIIEGDDNFFTVRSIVGARSAHEWLSQELIFFYPTGDAAQNVGTIDGREAIFLRGSGTIDSPSRVIVIQHNGQLLVISYDRDSSTFATMIESFKLTDIL